MLALFLYKNNDDVLAYYSAILTWNSLYYLPLSQGGVGLYSGLFHVPSQVTFLPRIRIGKSALVQAAAAIARDYWCVLGFARPGLCA